MAQKGKPQQALDNLMMACADLSGPGKGSSFKGPPVKDIKVQKAAAPSFRQSEKARDWTSLAQNLEDAFSVPRPPESTTQAPITPFPDQPQPPCFKGPQQVHIPPQPQSMVAPDTLDDFGDFQSCQPPPQPKSLDSLEPAVLAPKVPSAPFGGIRSAPDPDDDFADFVVARPISNSQQRPLPESQPISSSAADNDFGAFSSSSPVIPDFANFSKTPGLTNLASAVFPSSPAAPQPNIIANFNFDVFQPAAAVSPSRPITETALEKAPLPLLTSPAVAMSGQVSLPTQPPQPPGGLAPPMRPSTGNGGGDKYGALRDAFSTEVDDSAGFGNLNAPPKTTAFEVTIPGNEVLAPTTGSEVQSDHEDDFGDFIDARQSSKQPPITPSLTSAFPNAGSVFMPQTAPMAPMSSAAANVIPWHSSSPPPPPLAEDEAEGEPKSLSGVVSEIGGFDCGGGGSTPATALEESRGVPGMSSLATFESDDFYSQVDLVQQGRNSVQVLRAS